MAKKVTGYIKLQIPAGKAQHIMNDCLDGVNIVPVHKGFNAKTADQAWSSGCYHSLR